MINWRKGLFRLWIISATIWIIGIGTFYFVEYNRAVKKESKIKLIVSEMKNSEKALLKIKEEIPELMQHYGFKDLGPVEKSIKPPGDFDEFLPKDKSDHKIYVNKSKSILIPLDEFDSPDIYYKRTLNKVCKIAENDSINALYYLFIFSFIPPIILLTIGSAIYWALRGFRS